MNRRIIGAWVAVLLAVGMLPARADDKEVTWIRELDTVELLFKVGKETATFEAHVGDNSITVKGKLTPVKDKKDFVTFEVVDVIEKGEFPTKPKKGDKFSFKWVVKDDKATISEIEGTLDDEAKPVVAGDYKKKKQ
ncbi:MAG: hypothetical protein RMJ56_14010 [Gemmataceae bacterium]|nr:hypothetical protein [Gemmata sp.]MDW8198707.1 hypothetical protein [Gemmataceae bacterium]